MNLEKGTSNSTESKVFKYIDKKIMKREIDAVNNENGGASSASIHKNK